MILDSLAVNGFALSEHYAHPEAPYMSMLDPRPYGFVDRTLAVKDHPLSEKGQPHIWIGRFVLEIHTNVWANMTKQYTNEDILSKIYENCVPQYMKRLKPTGMIVRGNKDINTSKRPHIGGVRTFECIVSYPVHRFGNPLEPFDVGVNASIKTVEDALAERGSIPGDHFLWKVTRAQLINHFGATAMTGVTCNTCVILSYMEYENFVSYRTRTTPKIRHMLFPTKGTEDMWTKKTRSYAFQNTPSPQLLLLGYPDEFFDLEATYELAQLEVELATKQGRALQNLEAAKEMVGETAWESIKKDYGIEDSRYIAMFVAKFDTPKRRANDDKLRRGAKNDLAVNAAWTYTQLHRTCQEMPPLIDLSVHDWDSTHTYMRAINKMSSGDFPVYAFSPRDKAKQLVPFVALRSEDRMQRMHRHETYNNTGAFAYNHVLIVQPRFFSAADCRNHPVYNPDMTHQTATSGLPAAAVSSTAGWEKIYNEIIDFNARMDAHRYNKTEKFPSEDLLVAWRKIADIVGHDDQQIILLAGNLGWMHLAQKNYTAAVKELAENLPHRKLMFGHEDSRTLFTAASLAVAMFYANHDDATALPLLQLTVATMREKYGTEHDTIVFTNHLAIMLFECARVAEGEVLHSSVSKLANSTLGPNHPTSIWIRDTYI